MRWYNAVTVTALAVAVGACAATGGSANLRWDAGLATARDSFDSSRSVLDRYQYQIERENARPPDIFVITRWRQRNPFDDEALAGAESARTRFIVRARPSRRNAGGAGGGGAVELYSVTVRAENIVLLQGETDWREIEPTPALLAYAKEIADEIRAELETGIRVR